MESTRKIYFVSTSDGGGRILGQVVNVADRDVSHAEGMGAIVPQSLSPILSGARNVVMRWRHTKGSLAEMHTQEELNI